MHQTYLIRDLILSEPLHPHKTTYYTSLSPQSLEPHENSRLTMFFVIYRMSFWFLITN